MKALLIPRGQRRCISGGLSTPGQETCSLWITEAGLMEHALAIWSRAKSRRRRVPDRHCAALSSFTSSGS